jgi:hypothetical protein
MRDVDARASSFRSVRESYGEQPPAICQLPFCVATINASGWQTANLIDGGFIFKLICSGGLDPEPLWLT